MVMKRNMMGRNLRRSIVNSLGRYIAIATIIALGTAIFVGLRSTKMDMVATGQVYTDEQNMFDLRLISSYGWEPEQLAEFCVLDEAGQTLLKRAFEKLGMTARSYDRVLRLARTIADLEGAERIAPAHLAEAVQYRFRTEI